MPACVLVFAGADTGCLSTLLSTALGSPQTSPFLSMSTEQGAGEHRIASRNVRNVAQLASHGNLCCPHAPPLPARSPRSWPRPQPWNCPRSSVVFIFSVTTGDKKVLFPGMPCSVPDIPTSSPCPGSFLPSGGHPGRLLRKAAWLRRARDLACPS